MNIDNDIKTHDRYIKKNVLLIVLYILGLSFSKYFTSVGLSIFLQNHFSFVNDNTANI